MNKKDTAYSAKLKHANPLDLIFNVDESDLNKFEKQTVSVKIEQIKLDKTQPRRYFDPKKLEELAQSIRAVGILQPLLVRPLIDGGYELIAGERRFLSAGIANLEEVPVVIKEMDDSTVKEVRLIENLQREDLNAYEETVGILHLLALRLESTPDEVITLLNRMDKANRKKTNNVITQNDEGRADNVIRSEDIAVINAVFHSLGKFSPESFRTNRLPLLNLPEEIQKALSQGQIEYTKARAITKLKIADRRKQLLNEAIEKNLSLTEIKQRVREIINAEKSTDTPLLLKFQYKQLSKQLGSSKVWDNPKKKKALEKLLNQIKTLLEDPSSDTEA